MIIVLKENIAQNELKDIISRLELDNRDYFVNEAYSTIAIKDEAFQENTLPDQLKGYSGVNQVILTSSPFCLAGKSDGQTTSVVDIEGIKVGGSSFTVIAGPCGIESRKQILESAEAVREAGAHIFRASAYKPRGNPYDFQGLGLEGLKLLKEVREKTGLLVESEIMGVEKVELAAKYIDIFRVGARNMCNYDLLKKMARTNKPIIIKRGLSATIKDFILAGEYVMNEGNDRVILCERGISSFEPETRFTLDLSAVPIVKSKSHLPIIVDPSHAPGKRNLVPQLSKAALAVGSDDLIVEVHSDAKTALSDCAQQLSPEEFMELMGDLKHIAPVFGKKVW